MGSDEPLTTTTAETRLLHFTEFTITLESVRISLRVRFRQIFGKDSETQRALETKFTYVTNTEHCNNKTIKLAGRWLHMRAAARFP